jgi:superfamily II DNA or RNA helicase
MQLRPYQNDLVEQVREAWREGYKAPCIVLGCGGGKSCIVAEIARRTTWNGKRVLFLVHRRELVDQIFRTFVRWGVLMDLCEIGMVQTFTRRLNKLQKPTLIITDENHHSLAQSYKRIYEYFPDVPRVGVTATPVRLNGDGLGDVNDKLIIGVSTKWLIENHCLAPYDYYAPDIADLTGLHTKMGEYVTSDIEKAMIKKAVFGDVIRYYKQLADGKKAVCYCSSIKHSEKTAEAFRQSGISAAHIDGSTPKQERDKIIADFRNGSVTILCNVDLISEGFDVPDCECAILLRPTHSLTLYIQQSMRCMRYKPNKRAVIIDHVGNYARHGMPDDDREWTLEKKKRNKIQQEKEQAAKVLQCPECFFTFSPELSDGGRKICPHCGYMFPNKARTIEVEEETKLIKVVGFKLDYSGPEQCQSYAELVEYAKQHGYKRGWAFYQAKRRGLIA